jgi:tetratricopeptide (TPR) repeat protein
MLQSGRVAEAVSIGSEARKVARLQRDEVNLIAANYLLAHALNFNGEFRAAIQCAQEGMTLIQPRRAKSRFGGMYGTTSAYLRTQSCLSHAHLGEFAAAIRYGEDGWKGAKSLGRLYDISMARYGYGFALLIKGEAEQAIPVLEEGLLASEKHGVSRLFSLLASTLSCAFPWAGHSQRATELLGRVIGRDEASRYMRDWSLVCRALVLLETTSGAGAAETAQMASRLSRKDRYPVLLPWAEWALGRATAQTNPARAVQLLKRASTKAEALGMRPLLASILWNLGNFSRDAGKDGAAPICGSGAKNSARTWHEVLELRFDLIGLLLLFLGWH